MKISYTFCDSGILFVVDCSVSVNASYWGKLEKRWNTVPEEWRQKCHPNRYIINSINYFYYFYSKSPKIPRILFESNFYYTLTTTLSMYIKDNISYNMLEKYIKNKKKQSCVLMLCPRDFCYPIFIKKKVLTISSLLIFIVSKW